jgi:Domain of unknown function (DUF6457)
MDDVLGSWTAAVLAELGVAIEVDPDLVLDLAGAAARGVARPAAPLTAFLVGYAAGRAGGGPEAVADVVGRVTDLAARWAEEEAGERSGSGKA